MNIGIDMMGGDFAPLEAVKGVKLFLDEVVSSKLLVVSSDDLNATKPITYNLQPTTYNC